jgi:hypothetical protein
MNNELVKIGNWDCSFVSYAFRQFITLLFAPLRVQVNYFEHKSSKYFIHYDC